MARRWSDNDRYFGPFTFSVNDSFQPVGVVLDSGDGDEHCGCSLRVYLKWWTILCELPPLIRPYREWVTARTWDAAAIERLGRDGYWDYSPREYGFISHDGFFRLFYGQQTDDGMKARMWSTFIPWREWHHVRHSLYTPDGDLFWDNSGTVNAHLDGSFDAQKACPSKTFVFEDFDGERLTAEVVTEEREWRKGDGWFKWLAWFYRPKIQRCIDIRFSGETGGRKGSWKGGTLGHSTELLLGETPTAAFQRYCQENRMTFVSEQKTVESLEIPD